MSKLINNATSTGMFDGSIIKLTSNSVIVDLVNDYLSIFKSADKCVWKNGVLTFKITINNETPISYNSLVVTDVIDPCLATLIDGTVTINGSPASASQYQFKNGVLQVFIDTIASNSKIVIKFQLKRLQNEHFRLKNIATLNYNDSIIKSNLVIVTGFNKNKKCKINRI